MKLKSTDTVYCAENPLEELDWLKKIAQPSEEPIAKVEIYQCIYRQNESFLIDQCVGCTDSRADLYNCDGEVICLFWAGEGETECLDFYDNVELELIWKNY